jgi:hypothetical protein
MPRVLSEGELNDCEGWAGDGFPGNGSTAAVYFTTILEDYSNLITTIRAKDRELQRLRKIEKVAREYQNARIAHGWDSLSTEWMQSLHKRDMLFKKLDELLEVNANG